VKLSAGFERIVYVLSFDDEMVAEALGEKYGTGGLAAGRNFSRRLSRFRYTCRRPISSRYGS